MRAAPLPRRPLGRTGWRASVLALGGVKWDTALPEAEAVRLVRRAVELGVNTFDTAHLYGGGESERRLGLALEGLRDRVFVSTKTMARDRGAARRELELSLGRLRMERVDLAFVHDLRDEDDLRRVLAPDGVLRAMEELRAEGRIRFVGVSSHWFRASLLRILGEYPFDAALFPAGLVNDAYGYRYVDDALPAARARGMATMGMKLLAAGRAKHAASIVPYLRYAYAQPLDALVIGCDSVAQLEQLVAVLASDPPPLSAEEARALHPECLRITQAWDRGEFDWVSHYRGH